MRIKNLLCAAATVSAIMFPSIANAEVEKAYTLTPVENATDTSITLYDYDSETKTLNKTHNELTLNKTTYGSGNASTTVDVVVPNNKTQTITVNYDTSNPMERVVESNGKDINGNFINNKNESNSDSDGGGAISIKSNIDTIKGNFVNNYSKREGGAIYVYNDRGNDKYPKIKNIVGNFIGNYSNNDGGAIYNDTSVTNLDLITGNFICNMITNKIACD